MDPIGTFPKLRFVVLSCRCAFPFPGSFAKAGRDRPSAKSRKKLRTENAKICDFVRDMEDPPKNCGYERL